MKVSELVKDQTARFTFYRDGQLWYRVRDFDFPVPVEDTGSATFLAEDKAIMFVRWITGHLKAVEAARAEQG